MKEKEELTMKQKLMKRVQDQLLTMIVLNVGIIKCIILLCKEEVQMKDSQLFMNVSSAGI